MIYTTGRVRRFASTQHTQFQATWWNRFHKVSNPTRHNGNPLSSAIQRVFGPTFVLVKKHTWGTSAYFRTVKGLLALKVYRSLINLNCPKWLDNQKKKEWKAKSFLSPRACCVRQCLTHVLPFYSFFEQIFAPFLKVDCMWFWIFYPFETRVKVCDFWITTIFLLILERYITVQTHKHAHTHSHKHANFV